MPGRWPHAQAQARSSQYVAGERASPQRTCASVDRSVLRSTHRPAAARVSDGTAAGDQCGSSLGRWPRATGKVIVDHAEAVGVFVTSATKVKRYPLTLTSGFSV